MDMPDYIARNRSQWTQYAPDFAARNRAEWEHDEPSWGIWGIPETEVGLFPELGGRDVVELGCGTAYVSAWMARRGARVVGIDPTPAQLSTATGFQKDFDLRFPLVCAPAEAVPLADSSFDLAISEYGASIWSDPYRWIPEAARLLRPGGELVFLVGATLMMLCMPDADADLPAKNVLVRDYFGLHRIDWADDDSVEFHLGYGDWIRLLRANGFEIEDLIELRAPENAETVYDFVTPEWARRWPTEEVWKVRKKRG
ncbi:MAG: methyltransferase domain-containing protein [Actinobacteria bacterium]|nr:methyltransferase domain-containing protein [Actinomycetota bacterium]